MSDQAASPRQVLVDAKESSSQSLPLCVPRFTSQHGAVFARAVDFVLKPSVILLALVTVVVGRGISQGEFFYYGDEMRHAMNGVFLRDFLLDFPIKHPLQYAYEYYAKYPALAIPHWPPLFHFVEGLFFALFGLSPWVSRLTVLCFALLAVYFWYQIALRFGPLYKAFLSAVILACMPFVLLYERVTMLEIPALAMCLGAVHFWLTFMESERRRDLLAFAAFVVAAFLTSQKSIFLVFFVALHFIVERRFRVLRRLEVWLLLLGSIAAVLPWYVLASRTMSTWLTRVIGHGYGYLARGSNYSFYLTKVYAQLGPLLIGLACVGFVLALWKRTSTSRLLILWVLSGYLCFTLISEKDPRHTMLWVPPLIYLALTALEALLVRRPLAIVASSILASFFLVTALGSERPKLTGVEDAANYILSLPESDIVYYQGALDGNFIFCVRKLDPEKRHMVAREKQIVVSRLGWRPKELLHTQDEVLSFFQTWGIRYAVVEDLDPVPGLNSVRELLGSARFEMVRSFSVRTNQPNLIGRRIQVFRYKGELHRSTEPVEIPMLTIRHNIRADLSRLAGRPWPD